MELSPENDGQMFAFRADSRTNRPPATLALFCGLAPVPLQMSAGSTFSSTSSLGLSAGMGGPPRRLLEIRAVLFPIRCTPRLSFEPTMLLVMVESRRRQGDGTSKCWQLEKSQYHVKEKEVSSSFGSSPRLKLGRRECTFLQDLARREACSVPIFPSSRQEIHSKTFLVQMEGLDRASKARKKIKAWDQMSLKYLVFTKESL